MMEQLLPFKESRKISSDVISIQVTTEALLSKLLYYFFFFFLVSPFLWFFNFLKALGETLLLLARSSRSTRLLTLLESFEYILKQDSFHKSHIGFSQIIQIYAGIHYSLQASSCFAVHLRLFLGLQSHLPSSAFQS